MKMNMRDYLLDNRFIRKYSKLSIVAKASMWFMVCGVLQKGIAVITTPIFTRLLSTTQYGEFTIFNSWLQIFTIITTFRLDFSVFNKGMSKYPDRRDEYTASMQSAMSLLTIAVFIVYLFFSKQINRFTEMSTLVTCLMFLELLFMPAIRVWTLRQRYDYRYIIVVAVTLGISIANAVIGVIAVLITENKGFARIVSFVVVECVAGSIIYVINLKKGKKLFVSEFVKFAVVFNLPLIPYYFSSYVLAQADRIMIQKMVGLDKVAIYNLAQSVGLLMTIVTTSLNSALAPWEYQKLSEGKYKEIPTKFSKIMVIVVVALMLFMAFIPEIVMILASKEYTEAIYIIPSVTACAFFMLLSDLFSNVEFYYDKNRFATYLSIGIAVINIILNYIGINLFGYVAAGYTTLICYTIFGIGHVFYSDYLVKKRLGQYLFKKSEIFLYAGMLIGFAIVMTFLYSRVVLRYAVILGLATIVFVKRKEVIRILTEIKK